MTYYALLLIIMQHKQMDNFTAAENSASRSPEICYCGRKTDKKQYFTRSYCMYNTPPKPHVDLYDPDSLSNICYLACSLIVNLDRRSGPPLSTNPC